MDSITQATLGALCGELVLRKQLGWKGAAWGLFFGTLPDLDILAAPFLDGMEWLRFHRGISHGLLAIFLGPLLLAWPLAKLHNQVSFSRAYTFLFLTWFTHVLIDCFNSYGTQLYAPFSNKPVAFENIAIIDLFFTLPMLLGLIFCLFRKRESAGRTRLVTLVTLWICMYTACSFAIQYKARNYFTQVLAANDVSAEEMSVSPTLSNIFLWRMLAKTEDSYFICYWSLFDDANLAPVIDQVQRDPELAKDFTDSRAFQTIDWFSSGNWKAFFYSDEPDSIYLADMRFTEMHAKIGNKEVKVPPFMWKLTKNGDEVEIQRSSGRSAINQKSPEDSFSTKAGRTLEPLVRRIKGDQTAWDQGSRWPWETSELKDVYFPASPGE